MRPNENRVARLVITVTPEVKEKITQAAKRDMLPTSRWMEIVAIKFIEEIQNPSYICTRDHRAVYGEEEAHKDEKILSMYDIKRKKGIFLNDRELKSERSAFDRLREYSFHKKEMEESGL